MAVLKVEKVKLKNDNTHKGIAIKCEDNTPLNEALTALIEFENKNDKNKEFLSGAMTQKNVGIHLKSFNRYVPMGYVSQTTFDAFKRVSTMNLNEFKIK